METEDIFVFVLVDCGVVISFCIPIGGLWSSSVCCSLLPEGDIDIIMKGDID